MKIWRTICNWVKKETVLTIAWILALLSMFFVAPSKAYCAYIDFSSLGILWSLMIIMKGLQKNGVFDAIGAWLLTRTRRVWQLAAVLIYLCFFSSMFITNDVALLTFVPFAIAILENCKKDKLMIPVIALQTIAANLGSMLTPIGNPQNLYLYGISGMQLPDFIFWMMPYTLLSLVLLTISLCFIKGKSEPLAEIAFSSNNPAEPMGPNPAENVKTTPAKDGVSIRKSRKMMRIVCYGILFLLALLVVMHVISQVYVLVLAVLVCVFFLERKTLREIDYALLFTFVGFFIFTGNLGSISEIQHMLNQLMAGREIYVAVLASQGISNVPAALLLSGFTNHYKELLLGVNIGGLGTLIASMASLISFKILAHKYNEKKGKYFLVFTLLNLLYLVILLAFATWKTGLF